MNSSRKPLSDAEIDELYGLEPAIGDDISGIDSSLSAEFIGVECPYCGEVFETRVDTSSGSDTYVEDCQICCQPIEMELRVEDDGGFGGLVARRGDS
jgi:hypothetical protein